MVADETHAAASARSSSRVWPAQTRAPAAQFTFSMMPALGAATAISIFMASSTISFCPASTRCPASTAMFQTLAVTGERTGRHPSGASHVRFRGSAVPGAR